MLVEDSSVAATKVALRKRRQCERGRRGEEDLAGWSLRHQAARARVSAPHDLRVCTAALLIFLARSARAGIVPPNLGAAADYLLDRLTVAGTGHAGLL
jgi:hypothetical protein